MADNDFATLVSKDANLNSVSNALFVQLSDGTAAVGMVLDALKVSVTNASIPVTGTFWQATQPVSGTFWQATQPVSGTVAVTQSTSPWIVDGSAVTQPVSGTFWQATQPVSGTVAATQSGTWILGANSGVDIGDVTINNGAGASAVNIQDGGNSITVDGSVGITGTVTVTATSLDIRPLTLATDAIKISANGTANSAVNPIFVQSAVAAVTGAICDYKAATVNGGSIDNHDYTVVTSMLVKSIIVSSSGALKGELKVGPVGTLVSKAVLFIPKAGGSQQVDFDPPILVPTTSTGTVRIAVTNREGSSNDVYSTIIGIDA
jgi:hypothetical protein